MPVELTRLINILPDSSLYSQKVKYIKTEQNPHEYVRNSTGMWYKAHCTHIPKFYANSIAHAIKALRGERYNANHSLHLNKNSGVGHQHNDLATFPLGKETQYRCTGSSIGLRDGQGQYGPVHSTLPPP